MERKKKNKGKTLTLYQKCGNIVYNTRWQGDNMSFEIITDSCANLPREILSKYSIKTASLNCIDEGVCKKCFYENENEGINLKELYGKMRNKADISTSLAAPEEFERLFEASAKEGKDILCITVASTLSGTYQSAKIAKDIILIKYPNINIHITDTLNASLGEGLLVLEAAIKREAGEDFSLVVEFCEKEKYNICSWFTFDELYYLKKGGRVSSASAFLGTMLGIKPVMNVTKEGIIIPNSKVRGRKASLETLIKGFGECYNKDENQIIGITHGDCIDAVEAVKKELTREYGVKNFIVEYMDPVIGAHGGPGAIAVFFKGKKE